MVVSDSDRVRHRDRHRQAGERRRHAGTRGSDRAERRVSNAAGDERSASAARPRWCRASAMFDSIAARGVAGVGLEPVLGFLPIFFCRSKRERLCRWQI
jgi:hypothetical protein